MTAETLPAIPESTPATRRRRPRGRYPKRVDVDPQKKARPIPEYLEAGEVNAIIRAAPYPKAKLLMMEQWRAGLRVSEALDLEVRDLSLGSPNRRSGYVPAWAANHALCRTRRAAWRLHRETQNLPRAPLLYHPVYGSILDR